MVTHKWENAEGLVEGWVSEKRIKWQSDNDSLMVYGSSKMQGD